MLNLLGSGLPNVFLADGYHESSFDGRVAYSYSDLVGLYVEIAKSIALSTHEMTAAEFRFLRKRLELSQSEVGNIIGKTSQAVAKWEKEKAQIPKADSTLLRLTWLQKFAPSEILDFLSNFLTCPNSTTPKKEYVFVFSGKWHLSDRSWSHTSQMLCDETLVAIRAVAYSSEIFDLREGTING